MSNAVSVCYGLAHKSPPKARVVKDEVLKRGGLVRRLQDPCVHTQRGL